MLQSLFESVKNVLLFLQTYRNIRLTACAEHDPALDVTCQKSADAFGQSAAVKQQSAVLVAYLGYAHFGGLVFEEGYLNKIVHHLRQVAVAVKQLVGDIQHVLVCADGGDPSIG